MISLNNFDGASENPHPKQGLDLAQIQHQKKRDLTDEQIASLIQATNHSYRQDDVAAHKIAAVTHEAHGGRLPEWVCFALARFYVLSEMTDPQELEEHPVSQLAAKTATASMDFDPVRAPYVVGHLQEELAAVGADPTAKSKRFDPLSSDRLSMLKTCVFYLRGLLSQLSQNLDHSIHLAETKALFARFAEEFPEGSITGPSDWQALATTVGVVLEAATQKFETPLWLVRPMARSARECQGVYEAKKAWDENRMTFSEQLVLMRGHEKAHVKRTVDRLCRIISSEFFGDPDHVAGSLEEIQATYKDLGCRNGWQEKPHLYRLAENNFHPVDRYHTNATGGREWWVCHHLNFFYTVDCS